MAGEEGLIAWTRRSIPRKLGKGDLGCYCQKGMDRYAAIRIGGSESHVPDGPCLHGRSYFGGHSGRDPQVSQEY